MMNSSSYLFPFSNSSTHYNEILLNPRANHQCENMKNLWETFTAGNVHCHNNFCSLKNIVVQYLESQKGCALHMGISDLNSELYYEISNQRHLLELKRDRDILQAVLASSGDLSVVWETDNQGLTPLAAGRFSIKRQEDNTFAIEFVNGDVEVHGTCAKGGENTLYCSIAERQWSLFKRTVTVNLTEEDGETPGTKRYILEFNSSSPIHSFLNIETSLGRVEVMTNTQTGAFSVEGHLKDPAGNIVFNSTIKHDVEFTSSASSHKGRVFSIIPNLFVYDHNYSLVSESEAADRHKTQLRHHAKLDSLDRPVPVKPREVQWGIDLQFEPDAIRASGSYELSDHGNEYHGSGEFSYRDDAGKETYHFKAELDDSYTEFTHRSKR